MLMEKHEEYLKEVYDKTLDSRIELIGLKESHPDIYIEGFKELIDGYAFLAWKNLNRDGEYAIHDMKLTLDATSDFFREHVIVCSPNRGIKHGYSSPIHV